MKLRALALAAVCACTPANAPHDAHDAETDAFPVDAVADAPSLADAPSGPLVARIESPSVGYVNEPTCVTLAHNGGPDARITWTWEPEIVPEPGGERSCHTLASPGLPRVFARVEARGMRAEADRAVRIVPRPTVPAPTASSTIAYDAARSEVWVVNPDADTVSVISATTLSLVAEIPVGRRPRTVAISGGTAAVACADDGTLWLLEAPSRARLAAVQLGPGSEPFGVAADPRGARFVVTLQQSGELAVVDVASRAVLSRAAVGFDPRAIAVNAAGLALFTYWRASSEGARVGAIDLADPASPLLRAPALLGREAGIDSSTDNSGVPSFLNSIAFSPDGTTAVLGALKANVVTGRFRTRTLLTDHTTGRGMFSLLAVGTGASPVSELARLPLDNHDYVSSVTFSPEGGRFFITVQGSESLFAYDAATLNAAGNVFSIGGAPQGVAVSPDGARVFVQGYSTRTVRVFDVRDLGTIVAPLADIHTVAREPLAPEVQRGLEIFYRASDPRMSFANYVSCATCHQDGDGDNLVWDFTQRGEGLRNTISLRGHGGVGAYGPMHWSANFDEAQDFEHDIRDAQGGRGFIADELFHAGTRDTTLGDPKAGVSRDLDALAAYVTSLGDSGVSPYRRDDVPAWRAAFARGEAVFRSAAAQCATCHAGPRFTDSAWRAPGEPVLHDVGTLRASSGQRLGAALAGIDTPTLRGLWRTAPYLHDGSAATLREVLVARNADDRHGRTSGLAPTQLNDLVTFLLAVDDRAP